MSYSALHPKVILATLLLSSCACAMAAPAQQDELGWLKVMAFAAHRTDYVGTFIYQSGNHIETSRITHVLDADGEHERIEGLDGEPREIIRNNDQVWCALGQGKVLLKKREGGWKFPTLLPEQLSALNENYLIRHGDDDRVAGFHAHTLIFQPRDNLRYARKMWAHSDSGLLLKAVVLDELGQVIEQYAFTQLAIGGTIDRQWINVEQTLKPKQIVVSPDVAATAVQSGWQVGLLPPGFRKVQELSRILREGNAPVIHMVFSDGLAGISVFVESLSNRPRMRPGLYSQGSMQVYSKIIDGNLLTVVGEVPPATVLQVAESVRRGGK